MDSPRTRGTRGTIYYFILFIILFIYRNTSLYRNRFTSGIHGSPSQRGYTDVSQQFFFWKIQLQPFFRNPLVSREWTRIVHIESLSITKAYSIKPSTPVTTAVSAKQSNSTAGVVNSFCPQNLNQVLELGYGPCRGCSSHRITRLCVIANPVRGLDS